MFFIMGISDGRKDFEFHQMTICRSCGRYGRMMVYMTYTVLSLFFIPCIKWNKQYFVSMSCCGRTYRISAELGKKIARGENVEIRPEDLEDINMYQRSENWQDSGWNKANWSVKKEQSGKDCPNCGYHADDDFEFCPKCGTRL